MKPINNPNSAPAVHESGLITWTGKAIPCLGICAGDKLNSTVKKIADKVCELTSPLDLSTLTLQGALDIFNREEPANRTLINVLQLLLDNEVGLKELIDGLQAQVDGIEEDNLVLDLKCLAVRDSFGNAIPYTQETVLQSFINSICEFKDTVADVAGALTDLTVVVNNHINKPEIVKENSISTCITPEETPVSQSVILFSQDYCSYKGVVGSSNSIQSILGKQVAEINLKMAGTPGWIASPVTMAQSLSNLWLYEKYNDDRITAIENNCCKVDCKDVNVGYNIVVGESYISVVFSSLAGTDIPAGFEDRGSKLIMTDKNGATINYGIQVANDVTRGDFPFTGLNTEGPINVSLVASLGTASMLCQKVVSKTFTVAANQDCCVITNNSAKDNTIVYQITSLT